MSVNASAATRASPTFVFTTGESVDWLPEYALYALRGNCTKRCTESLTRCTYLGDRQIGRYGDRQTLDLEKKQNHIWH